MRTGARAQTRRRRRVFRISAFRRLQVSKKELTKKKLKTSTISASRRLQVYGTKLKKKIKIFFKKKVFIISASQHFHAWLLWVFWESCIKKKEFKNADDKHAFHLFLLFCCSCFEGMFLEGGFHGMSVNYLLYRFVISFCFFFVKHY